jgi:hypothetical protein
LWSAAVPSIAALRVFLQEPIRVSRISTLWNRRWPLASLVLSLPIVALGCSATPGTVSGKVTYKGATVKGGHVSFANMENTEFAMAPINPDGTYTAERVPLGEVKISVETLSAKPVILPKGAQIKSLPGKELPEVYQPKSSDRYVKIPPEYSNPEMSGLRYTVTSGPQTKDIELK